MLHGEGGQVGGVLELIAPQLARVRRWDGEGGGRGEGGNRRAAFVSARIGQGGKRTGGGFV